MRARLADDASAANECLIPGANRAYRGRLGKGVNDHGRDIARSARPKQGQSQRPIAALMSGLSILIPTNKAMTRSEYDAANAPVVLMHIDPDNENIWYRL